jgi:small multidrug resistance pump
LRAGAPVGVAYGIWAAVGVALTAIASKVVFHESLTRTMALGMALVAVGVLLIELGAG